MTTPGAVNTSLIATDPIVARNFFLEIPGMDTLIMQSVSGLDVELDVVEVTQNGKDGKQQHIKTLGGTLKTPTVTMTRMAPQKAESDPIWKWFLAIRDGGFASRSSNRQNGSIVLYDGTLKEVARFNFFNGWPSKISTDQLSSDSNDAMKETIEFQTERIERTK
jgi:phage tail-like protein